MNYSHKFSICISAACLTADRMRHQFVTPEHFLLAIMQLPSWRKCVAHISESNRFRLQCEINAYINALRLPKTSGRKSGRNRSILASLSLIRCRNFSTA